MDLRRRGLLVIARMALQDGNVAREELETLANMSGGLTERELNEIIDEARNRSLHELLNGIESYEDRFVIALRAYHMAHSDRRVEVEEEMTFDLLVDTFGITQEDRALIERVQEGITGQSPVTTEPRLIQLHKGSSFHSSSH